MSEIGEIFEVEDAASVAPLPSRRRRRTKAELAATVEPAPKKYAGDRMVRIQLEESDDIPPGGQFLAVNGRSFALLPGVPVDVPRCVVDILDGAVTSIPLVDPQTRQVIGYRSRLRFPYRTLQA